MSSPPSPRTDSESCNQLDDADDVFRFDAPAYYDLKNPALEARYVNNADGYFTPGAYERLRGARYREPPREDADEDDGNDGDAHMSDCDGDGDDVDTQQLTIETTGEDMLVDAGEPATLSLSRSLLQDDDRELSFEEVFAQYASPSQQQQQHSPEPDARKPPPPPLSASSKLLQPTQAFLRRVHTEQALRAQQQLAGAPLEDKPLRLTKPRSPTLRTSRKAAQQPADRMSYTSRELLKIQEERLRVQMDRMKIREFHERSKAQRPPANVHQRSTKQLTIPVSPYLEVGHRSRRGHAAGSDASDDGMGDNNSSERVIRPETLMSRDFALPAPQHQQHHDSHDITRPAPPHLLTADRASRRAVRHEELPPPEKPSAPDYAAMRVNGVTQPMTPQLLTSKRAQSHRRPIDAVDEDEVELAKKFHAQPVSRGVLEPRAPPLPKAEKPPLTHPVSPKLSTSSRVASRQSATERAAAAIADLERRRKEREQQRLKARESSRPPPAAPRGPTVPETPDLKSIRLHRQYQENLRRRVAAEEEQRKKQREFKANPIRLAPAPPKIEGSSKPLTEVVPFSLPGEQYHQRALERLEAKKREEEERLQAQTHFRAMPMPVVHDASSHENGGAARPFHVRPSSKPLTRFAAPELASDRRAAERAAFDAAERERRVREEEYKKQVEEEARQRQEDELKELRRERLVFHARPVPEVRAFTVKPSGKPLTEPHSPALHYHPPRSSASSSG